MCTVLRDGRDVASFVPGEGGEAQIVASMLGEAATVVRDEARARGAGVARSASGRSSRPSDVGAGRQLDDVSLPSRRARCSASSPWRVRARTRCSTSSPATASADRGELVIDGRPVKAGHPFDVIRRGVVLVPADRLHALLPQRSIRENIAAPLFNRVAKWGPINGREERARASTRRSSRLSIDTRAASQVRRLSGGNQQKVTIARWLAARAAGDAAVRPDARHRRRHQAPGLRPRAVARRRGRGGHDVHQRAPRDRRSSATARPCSTAAASSPSCRPTPARTALSRAAHGLEVGVA